LSASQELNEMLPYVAGNVNSNDGIAAIQERSLAGNQPTADNEHAHVLVDVDGFFLAAGRRKRLCLVMPQLAAAADGLHSPSAHVNFATVSDDPPQTQFFWPQVCAKKG
jgi:hypothetical protein